MTSPCSWRASSSPGDWRARALWRRSSANELDPGPITDLDTWVRGNTGGYWHPVGTCRMGPADDPGAVVDAAGRVHGVEGLVVADASIFPTIPRANTNLPTMGAAEYIASTLAGA